MLNSELQERGKQLVEELELSRRDTLQRWMAFYITELMERAIHGRNQKIRREAATECSDIITKLWQLQLERTAYDLRSRTNSFRISITDDSESKSYELLLQYVTDPGSLSNTVEKLAEILAQLYAIERNLLTLLRVAVLVSDNPSDELTQEAVEKIINRDEELLHLNQLALIFPTVAELDIREKDKIEEFVTTSLQRVYEIRMQLLLQKQD